MADDKDKRDVDGTETVDLGDADVSAVDLPPSNPLQPAHERSVPPPLPPEVRASSPPMHELGRPPSNAPPPPIAYVSVAPPPPRSNRFYVMIVVAVLAIGIVGGIAVAMGTRGDKKPTVTVVQGAAPTAPKATGSVMTLPTIEMNDDEGDGGK